jgi:hypothetical protein
MWFEVSMERKRNEKLSGEKIKEKKKRRKKKIYCKDFVWLHSLNELYKLT